MKTIPKFILFLNILQTVTCSSMCRDNSICSHILPAKNFDLKWVTENQPENGWHMELANNIVGSHVAEVLQGKNVRFQGDFSKICGRVKFEHGESQENSEGTWMGFEDKVTRWKCRPSNDNCGALSCYFENSLTGYNKTTNIYPSFTDNKNIAIVAFCFPNGKSGWFTYSISTSLSDDEKTRVLDHVQSLGFDRANVASLYGKDCSKINYIQ